MNANLSDRAWTRVLCGLVCIGASLAAGQSAAQGANTSLIKLTYRCGNWFRVRNFNTVDVPTQYRVYRTSESAALTLPAAPTGIGYSESWFHTNNRGAVLLTYNGARVAEKPNGNVACAAVASMGQWTDTLPWPIVAIHSHLLPNGKVLTWGREHPDRDGYAVPPGKHKGIPNIWDPVTGTFTFVDAGADLFC